MITLGVTWFFNLTWNLKCHRLIKDLCLSKIDVPSLMTFREKFIQMVNNYTPEEFCMVHYLNNHTKSSLYSTIEMETKFQEYYDRIEPYGGIIQMGSHLLDNDEVYTVLFFMARPKSELEMK